MTQKAPIPETDAPFIDDADLWEWVLQGGWIRNPIAKLRWNGNKRVWFNPQGQPVCAGDSRMHATDWRRAHPPKKMVKVTRYVNVYREKNNNSLYCGCQLHKDVGTAQSAQGDAVAVIVAAAVPVTFEVEEET